MALSTNTRYRFPFYLCFVQYASSNCAPLRLTRMKQYQLCSLKAVQLITFITINLVKLYRVMIQCYNDHHNIITISLTVLWIVSELEGICNWSYGALFETYSLIPHQVPNVSSCVTYLNVNIILGLDIPLSNGRSFQT